MLSLRRPAFAASLVLAASVILLAGCASASVPAPEASPSNSSASPTPRTVDVAADLEALEAEYDARVGVSAVDTGDGSTVEFRAGERFGFASTLKALAAAQFLRQVPDSDRDEMVSWTQSDVDSAGYSPVTSERIDEGLSLAQLAEAAVRESDNTALNLIVARLGGPAALDAGLTDLGDTVTEVVNVEPELNTIEPGSTDDTTTPRAFTTDLRMLAISSALSDADRQILIGWMSDNATGDALIRAGAPEGWVVADKSGGAGPIRNDIALVTPPGRAPIVITVLTTKNDADAEFEDSLVAATAKIVLDALG